MSLQSRIQQVTILGQHIRIIRPEAPKVHITSGAWKRPRKQRPITRIFTPAELERLRKEYESG